MNRVFLVLGSILIFLIACNKTDSPITAEEDLRSGTWVRTLGKVTYKDPFTRGDSIKSSIDSSILCRLDNSLTFSTNNQGAILLGNNKCSAGEPDAKSFTWQMTADGKRISLYHVQDFFAIDNIDADVITRTLGYLTIRYRVIVVDPTFHTADTLVYTDVLRRF